MTEKQDKLLSPRFVLALLSIVLFVSTYYAMMPVLPLYMKSMGSDNFQIGLVMGIFSTVSLVVRPIAGKLSDRRDPVKLMRLSIVVFFLVPLCFLVPSYWLMGLAQGIYGFTIGMFSTASGLVVTGSVEDKLVGQAIGIHSIACIVAKGISPTIGSEIYARFGIFGAVSATVLFGVVALVLSFRMGSMQADVQDGRQEESQSMLRVYAQRTVWGPSLVLLTVTLTFGAIMTMLPLFAVERGIAQYSLFFTVNTVTAVVVRLSIGKRSLSERGCIISSLLCLTVAVWIVSAAGSLPMLLVAAVIYGYGYGMSYPTLTSIVMIKNHPSSRGTAFGALTAFFDVGVALGSAFGGLSEYLGFRTIYRLAGFAPLLGLALYMLLLMRHKPVEAVGEA